MMRDTKVAVAPRGFETVRQTGLKGIFPPQINGRLLLNDSSLTASGLRGLSCILDHALRFGFRRLRCLVGA